MPSENPTWILCENTGNGQRVAYPVLSTGISFDLRGAREEARIWRKHEGENEAGMHPLEMLLKTSMQPSRPDDKVLKAYEVAEAIIFPAGGGSFPARGVRATDKWSEVVEYTLGSPHVPA